MLPFEYIIENLTTSPMLNYFKNSIIITVGVLIRLLLINFMAGFALSKIQFRGNEEDFVLLFTWIDASVSGCIDSVIHLFLVRWESSTPIRQSFCHRLRSLCHTRFSCFIHSVNSFPDEIIEAAIIDGCSPMRTFFKIVFPMSTNSLLTVATMQECLYME